MIEMSIKGLKEFERAIERNPQYVTQRGNLFITRGLAEYRRAIMREPWKKGMSGGGAPVATGNLRDTHQQEVSNLEGRIYPTAPYAKYVHGVPGYARTRNYQLRPWLDYAADAALPAIELHEQNLFDDIMKQLVS